MPYAPHRAGRVLEPRENKGYECRLYQPHILTEAVNALHPDRATRYAVNIGAGDGASCNDPLFLQGYAGLAVEGGEVPALATNLPAPNIRKLTGTLVTPMNVGELLREASCPVDCDFFKIDIDGYDGPVLKAVLGEGYRPKVLQLEVNPEIPPPIAFSVLYHPRYRVNDPHGHIGGFYGASVAYVLNAAGPYGYRLAYLDFVTEWTHDITLVRADLFEVAAAVFGEGIRSVSARDMYLAHPPGYSHFAEHGIDSLAWRYRTDYHGLLAEIWEQCLAADAIKHEEFLVPFELSC